MGYEGTTTHTTEALLLQYKHSGDTALRDKLAAAHLYIADIVARRFSGRGVDYDDLYQVASIALLKAIERFDAGKGVKFVSFATPTMVGEVKNYFRDRSRLISLPRRSSALQKRIRDARSDLEQRLMRAPTPTELADALDAPLDEVLEAMESQGAANPLSLDAVPVGVDESPLSSLLGREEEGFERFDERDQVARALECLSEDERRVITSRYFDDLSQRVIGEEMGVSQMTISRVERRALEKIRAMLSRGETEDKA